MPVNVLGYEVYLDGEKVADTNDTEYTFRNLSNGTHTASVVQKFDTGNSAQLTISFDILTTGIKTVADNLLAIYTMVMSCISMVNTSTELFTVHPELQL